MRVNIVGQGGYSSAGLSINGATLTGPLTLVGNPVAPLEAATKQYVDLVGNNLDASKITTGTLAVGRMPAFTGDLSSTSGNNVLTLSNTGVTAGTYTKVTVDAKGRVTGTGNITLADIPNLDWSKITSGKPTTLSGYGITNGVSVNGDSVLGYITAHADPTSGLQLATKQYVDIKTATGGVIPAGTTIRRTSTVTPAGYLRCNGGLASKTAYPALYAIFGDNEVSQYSGTPGAGQPWRQQYEFNTTQSADVTGWSSTVAPTLNDLWFCLAATKDKVYTLGSYVGGNYSGVFVAPINANGTIGAWGATTSLPSPRQWSNTVVTKNRIYMIGGYSGSTYLSSTVTAPINPDGTLGAWTTGPSLPAPRFSSAVFSTKTRVYAICGHDANNPVSTVYSAPINEDGTLGGWVSEAAYPLALSELAIAVTKNRVYVIGGWTDSISVAAVYTAVINADGTLGAWTATNPLPESCSGSDAVVTKNRVYLWGGWRGNAIATPRGYSAPINADGTLGTWTACTPLPGNVGNTYPVVTNSKIYLYGNTDNFSTFGYVANFSGGLNDYSTFYTTGYVAVDPDNFRLPDTTTTDTGGLYTYIKT